MGVHFRDEDDRKTLLGPHGLNNKITELILRIGQLLGQHLHDAPFQSDGYASKAVGKCSPYALRVSSICNVTFGGELGAVVCIGEFSNKRCCDC